MNENLNKHIFVIALVLTALVFSLGLLVSYGMDFLRVNEILSVINNHNIDSDAYLVEKEFIDIFGGNVCDVTESRIFELKDEVEQLGKDMSRYGERSIFRKSDFEYLRRKYFLLQLKLYNLIEELNKNCGDKYPTILFFFEINDDISERQGFVLSDLAKEHKDIFIFSFDKDYNDEPSLNLIMSQYNVSKSPALVFNSKIKVERLIYLGEIESLLGKLQSKVDFFAKQHDLDYTVRATGLDKEKYIRELHLLTQKDLPNLVKADIFLILGRLTDNDNHLCSASDLYKDAIISTKELKALSYETIASINCNGEKKDYLLNASTIWRSLGNYFRAELDKSLADDQQIKFYYDIQEFEPTYKNISKWSSITIGNSFFKITDSDLIVSQTDRVTRDWLTLQFQSPFAPNLLTVFSEMGTWNEEELLPEIGWHEGARIKELLNSGASHLVASGTVVKKINNKWYAPDEKGIFKFEVPLDKIYYPTTRFLREDIAIIIDTHGINMLVEQAMRNKASVVVGCCDHPAKIAAAKYLSDNNIKVICFTDKDVPQLLFSGVDVLGSPPIKSVGEDYVVGNQPITINKDDKIVVMNALDSPYALWYYKTPFLYFSQLAKSLPIEFQTVTVGDFGQMKTVIRKAQKADANIIAVRVYSENDYSQVKFWLEESPDHKAILFHSVPYPFGYKLLREFPAQTAFDDIAPVII